MILSTFDKNRQIGRAGEFLAAYVLTMYDIKVGHIDVTGDDLWCRTQKNFYQCQVKTTIGKYLSSKEKRLPKYHFQLKNNQNYPGVFILVALDTKLILCKKWDEIPVKVFKIRPEEFTEEAQDKSIKRIFK
ncbi:MAG: hypothetical protein CMF29_08570 [Kiritimatiellaceae bacterium]|nr:hypothetical protein [Kiritimatiellaceae bacterium]